jgi:ABC-2 type transport system permease protein
MLSAMIKKEFILVLRDKHALLSLFVLPAIFILIMSVAMRDQFSRADLSFTVDINDSDNNAISKKIIEDIQKDKHLKIDPKEALFILTIPPYYSSDTSQPITIEVKDSIKSDQIEIFKSVLAKHILDAKFHAISLMAENVSPLIASSISSVDTSIDKLYTLKYNDSAVIPNSTQQSVPAWIVFGMFFIIIPMSTIYVNERKQNTLTRLNSMNVSIFMMMFTKSIPYMIINQVQVWIMLGVGIFVVPLCNTPALEINGSIGAVIAISTAISIAAVGVSSLIAVSASSSEQATTIGGITNILLGALGGVMVPKFIMPESMQRLADISPMSWGLDGFLDIFLKTADLQMIMPNVIKLVLFGGLLLCISVIVLQFKIRKGL